MGKDFDLLHAVKNNDVGAVRKILGKIWSTKTKKTSKKYNLNLQDEDGFTALHHAALKGNTDITMALLDIQCNVNARDKKGMAPLHLASWAGKTEIARLLVEARACVNICADSGDTPLHLACQHCNVGVVEVLLDSNVDTTVVNKNGESALDLACRFGHTQVVDMLLKSKDCSKLLSLYEQNPKTADPPLHISCKTGREEIVVMLLDAGADINEKGANGTPLHEASLYGKTDCVKILLDNGADVNISNDEGHLPLDLVMQFTSSRASQEIKDLLRDASRTKTVTAKAIHDYQNLYDPTCLAFRTGDVIEILEQNESGRWKGKITTGKRELIGYFPASMVKIQNSRRSGGSSKTMSMKNAGVLPVGKYDLVTLPSAAGQSSPVHTSRPRMSSFGKPNSKHSPSPPLSPEKEQKQTTGIQQPSAKRNRLNPIANGLEESKLFNKNKESLQYVEVAVDDNSSPPTSPGASNGFRTQYAEVVLHSPINGTSEEEEPPSLPQKSYKQENEKWDMEGRKGKEHEDSIWVKNASDQPELPQKASSILKDKTTAETEKKTEAHVENELKEEMGESKMENENENGMKMEMEEENEPASEEDLLLTHNASTDLERAIQNLDPNDSKTQEKPKINYEDMSLNSPDREKLPERKVKKEVQFSPRKLDINKPEPRGSPSTERRQVLDYENIELNKHRPKDTVNTMLITDIDLETDPDYVDFKKGVSPDPSDIAPNKSHRYENVPQGFDSTDGTGKEGPSQDYEEMGAVESENLNYENMTGAGLGEKKFSKDLETTGYVHMQGAEEGSLSRIDSYENVDLKTQESSGSAEYMSMSDGAYTGPNREYINIQVPASIGSADHSVPGAPSGLTMSEYNCLYDWLESCKLAIYMDNFVQGGFDMMSMAGLTAEDLTAINIVKTGHRKKLLSESNKLKLTGDVFPQERPEDIMTWLRLIHLDQYTPQFIDNGFDDMDFVQDITIEDLVAIGITKPGHQRKIWLAVNALGLNCPESGGIDKNPVADNGKPPSVEGYLETDLDMVEEKRMKEREGMEILNTDIDSALSRLPADGASDVAGTFEDVGIEHERMRNEEDNELAKKTLDRDMASLQIDSLNETRGSTPNLDSILDSLDKDSSSSPERKIEKSTSQPGQEKRSSGPFQMSFSRRSRSSSKDRMSAESEIQSRSSFDNRPLSSEATDTGSNNRSSQEAAHSAAGLGQDERSRPANKEPDFIRARHNTMESKSTVPVDEFSGFDQRARGTSFDSMTANKRPPPPVKPKSFKKPPPIAPKPTGSTSKTRLEHQVAKKETAVKDNSEADSTDTQNNERNLNTGSSPKKAPLSILPKTQHGRVHSQSTSSEDSIEAVLEDLETRNRFDDRRKSFEKLRRRFTDLENCGSESSGLEDEISEVRTRCDSQQELQEQIKDVFRRRSQENLLVEQDQLRSLNQETSVSKEDIDTDEELLKDQQYTEDLMKDINSMLSDFSTEIDTMFDDQPEKSTSV